MWFSPFKPITVFNLFSLFCVWLCDVWIQTVFISLFTLFLHVICAKRHYSIRVLLTDDHEWLSRSTAGMLISTQICEITVVNGTKSVSLWNILFNPLLLKTSSGNMISYCTSKMSDCLHLATDLKPNIVPVIKSGVNHMKWVKHWADLIWFDLVVEHWYWLCWRSLEPQAVSSPSVFFCDLVGWTAEMRPGFRAQQLLWVSSCNNQLALVPPSSYCACCAANPSCPGARTEQSLLGWGGDWGVSRHCATFSWLSVLTGGGKGGCCVSDWWGQVCGLGIGCCRTDVLLAHPALSAARPPALRTRLIGTPNCPYEYFRGEQEWEFRVGGMVSRALTANDPLNNQRERERQIERPGVKTVRKIFNSLLSGL